MKPPYGDAEKLTFGRMFTEHMYTIKYREGQGWYDGKIEKYRSFMMDPAACVFHYSQEVFEGLKAYKTSDGRILLFRPEQNARRLNRSARKLCMPELPEEIFLNALKELVLTEKDWIPDVPGTSLYIRPTMIASEAFLGVNPAKEYLFYIILSPVGAYFKAGFNPVSIYVEDQLVRAAVGGVGDIKTGGNYAASLLGGMKAENKGFSQVLWLDAKEHQYVEEVGAMNVFFVFGEKLVTPMLTGSILPGITRDSVLKLAHEMGYEVEERRITIDEVLAGIKSKELTEIFGSGTAAVISPVGLLHYKDTNYYINDNQVGKLTRTFYEHLVDIQYGRAEDKLGWSYELQDF
jgi:branched-chain amino acid aminotransferase